MRRVRIYLICLAVVIITGMLALTLEAAPDPSGNNFIVEGQMFVVRLIPAGERIEVLVTGKRMAQIDYSDLGLTARLEFGDKSIVIPSKRKTNKFQLENLPSNRSNSTLKLRLRIGSESEDFSFKMPLNKL